MGNKTSYKKGHQHTAETLAKIGNSKRGKPLKPETIAKMVASRKGYTHSPETRAKIALANTGKKPTPEQVEKFRQRMLGHTPWNKGKKFSTQTTQEIHKRWLDKNPEERIIHARRWHLKNKFGITLEEFDVLFSKQDGKCAICGLVNEVKIDKRGRSSRLLHIDHDHKTGNVRGLLCQKCNVGLGSFKDAPDLLSKAAGYLTNIENNH